MNSNTSVDNNEKECQRGRKILYIIIFVLILLLLISTGVIIFILSKDKERKGNLTDTSTTTTTANNSSTTVTSDSSSTSTSLTTTTNSNPYAGWLTYENHTYDYSIKYPSTWLLDNSQAEKPEGSFDNILKISNGEYRFFLNANVLVGGGDICDFDDTPSLSDMRGVGPANIVMGERFEMVGEIMSISRNKNGISVENIGFPDDKYGAEEQELLFLVCEGRQGSYFQNNVQVTGTIFYSPHKLNTNFEFIYLVPDQYDSVEVEILDLIYKSFNIID